MITIISLLYLLTPSLTFQEWATDLWFTFKDWGCPCCTAFSSIFVIAGLFGGGGDDVQP